MACFFVCGTCHGKNVEVCQPAWVDPNTDRVIDIDAEADWATTWCRDCQEHVPLLELGLHLRRGTLA